MRLFVAAAACISQLLSLGHAVTVTTASSAPLPPDFTPPQLLQVVFNASMLFGWQLAGRAINTEELIDLCNHTNAVGHGKWAPIGLSPMYISEPSCNVGAAHLPSSAGVNAGVNVANTNILLTQLLNAFNETDTTTSLTYLCKTIRPSLLTPFGINTDHFFEVICGAARSPIPQVRYSPVPTKDQLRDFINATSSLFAYELGTSSATTDQAVTLCQTAPRYADHLTAQRLDARIFQKVLCSIKEPLDNDHASSTISEWATAIFVRIIAAASDSRGWNVWLCKNLDIAHMNAAALNGTVVSQQICGGGQSGRSD